MDADSKPNDLQVRHGSCICKRVRYTLTGEPLTFRVCHCPHCKKASGSAFLSNLFFKEEHIHVLQGEDDLTIYQDDGTLSGFTLERHFCKHCGSNVFLRSLMPLAVEKKVKLVTLGTLDSTVDWVPVKETFPQCRSPFVKDIGLASGKPKL